MSPDHEDIPGDWDTLTDRSGSTDGTGPASEPPPDREFDPALITLMATSWADLVSMLAVCTCALVAILALGERPTFSAFAWAAVLSFLWWGFAAALLVVVRQGTPGMLLAGVSFDDAVAPDRVPWVLAAALLGVVTLGLTGVLGSRRSILALAAESNVVCSVV